MKRLLTWFLVQKPWVYSSSIESKFPRSLFRQLLKKGVLRFLFFPRYFFLQVILFIFFFFFFFFYSLLNQPYFYEESTLGFACNVSRTQFFLETIKEKRVFQKRSRTIGSVNNMICWTSLCDQSFWGVWFLFYLKIFRLCYLGSQLSCSGKWKI